VCFTASRSVNYSCNTGGVVVEVIPACLAAHGERSHTQVVNITSGLLLPPSNLILSPLIHSFTFAPR